MFGPISSLNALLKLWVLGKSQYCCWIVTGDFLYFPAVKLKMLQNHPSRFVQIGPTRMGFVCLMNSRLAHGRCWGVTS